ncbi:MAG: hypothetical protein OHK0021_06400 [Bryobacter sp.]
MLRRLGLCLMLFGAGFPSPSQPPSQPLGEDFPEDGEFHFLRLEYQDAPEFRRPFGRRRLPDGTPAGWWAQDWPEAEMHFRQGIARLTRIAVGGNRHTHLRDDRIFEYPWIYATQVGWWDLSDAETRRLGQYLERGGFLMVDDFFGRDWQGFRAAMERTLPGAFIEDLPDEDPVMSIVFPIRERVFIPGLRHLRNRAPDGTVLEPTGQGPQWRGMRDKKGRLVVAIHFNQDVGDAWEHADWVEYPENMTSLAYRFGINHIVYAMTH